MTIYDNRGTLWIGFHGCDRSVRDGLLLNPFDVRVSRESYDWLGSGFYIWEGNYQRALQWALDKQKRCKYPFEPAVVGVVYELSKCLDLTDSACIKSISNAYQDLKELFGGSANLPTNRATKHSLQEDMILRDLDCAVINYLCYKAENQIDTARGVFIEGGPVYEGGKIYEKTHIQICIKNLDCIKGFFMPKV